MNNQENNKRIVKNTLFLYIRMIVLMLVTLYTSRVILKILGVEDYGIWNLIAGVIVLFSFIQNAMATAIQRFISFEIGKNNISGVYSIYYNSVTIHCLIALIVLLLGETVGIYFLKYGLNIPSFRLNSTIIAFQFVIFDTCFKIIRLPANAMILAYEKMSFYAYISIVEAIASLLIVYVLYMFNYDKLILYSFLTFLVTLVINAGFFFYCYNIWKIKLCKLGYDKRLFRSLLSFSGWTMLGSIASVGSSQGVNIVLNIFFGVTVNAAMGIATQVNGAVNKFISNFQVAFRPQLVKSYSSSNIEYLKKMIIRTSKLSFMLSWFLAFPVLVNIPFILEIWLGIVPDYTIILCQLILVTSLIECISAPLWMTIQATGKIRRYQLAISTIILSNLLFSYIALKLGLGVYSVLIVKIVVDILALTCRMFFSVKLYDLEWREFLYKVLLRCLILSVISFIPSYLLIYNIEDDGFIKLIVSCVTFLPMYLLSSYFLCLDNEERIFLKNLIIKFYDKKRGAHL